jgi:hypothetical protein
LREKEIEIFSLLTELGIKVLIGEESKPNWVNAECEGIYMNNVIWLPEKDSYVAIHEAVHVLVDKRILPKAKLKVRKGKIQWSWLGINIPNYFIEELSSFVLEGENKKLFLEEEIPAYIGEQLGTLVKSILFKSIKKECLKETLSLLTSKVDLIKDSL